jgi:hypothetical protein
MKRDADELARRIRDVIVSYFNETSGHLEADVAVRSEGRLLGQTTQEREWEVITVDFPAKYGQMFLPGTPKPPGPSASLPCPHCGKGVRITT